jgi:DNA-binding CsgD family transcriptional regulator
MEILEADSADYRIRQSAAEIEYAKSYRSWVDSLPPEERRELAALGLDSPELPRRSAGVGLSCDAAEQGAAQSFDEIAAPDPDEGISTGDLRIMEALQKLIGELVTDRNPRLATECLALVCSIAYQGNSLTEIAARHGLSRAAISKRCLEMSERLGVKNRRALRSDHAREAYAEARIASLKKQGKIHEPTRREPLVGQSAARCKVAFDKLRPEWIKTASAAELLLARRSLRPAFQVADELERMIREKGDRGIIRELEHDLAL